MAIMHALGTPQAPLVHARFMSLIERMVGRRKSEPRRDDVVDALLHGTVAGRPLTKDEIQRALLQLIAAGLDTTAHALGNMLATLTGRPELLRAGDPILLLVAAANRDPAEFDAADTVDFERDRARNLAFGYGAHYCVGVHLARLELRVALEELLARLSDIRIDETRVTYDSGCSSGPTELHIQFAPGPVAR